MNQNTVDQAAARLREEYHRKELEIALDPHHPNFILPPALTDPSMRVLDIGCGAGQTLIATYPDRISFGLDLDLEALQLGRTFSDKVCFVCGTAETLPWPDRQFDQVIARVSLPYTNLSKSLREVRRVLRPGGLLWIILHPLQICWNQAKSSNYKGRIFFGYIVLNSMLFHFTQKQFPFRGRYESFQTRAGISKALRQIGFDEIRIEKGKHFVVTAKAR